MDGRQYRLWLCGGLILGALGCHKQQMMPGGLPLPSPGQPTSAKSPSLFSKTPSPPKAEPAVIPTPTANRTTPAPTSPDKVDISPNTLVAFADVRAELAFGENTPAVEREKQIDSARQSYQVALKKDPTNRGALLGLARLYTRLNEINRADEMYRHYLTANPKEHAVMHEVALAHAKAKDFNGAAAWCQAALKVDPENRGYRKTLGFCLTHAGRWDDGFAILCEVMPEAEARYTMARAFLTLQKPEMGHQQLALAIQADPNFAAARELLADLQQPPTPTPRSVEPGQEIQAVQYQQAVSP